MTASQPSPAVVEPRVTLVTPTKRGEDLRELWEFRELLYYLVWRSIKVRYKQTFLGASWAVLQPLLTMLVLSIFLGRLAHVPSSGIPYPLFAYAGLVVWTFFTSALSQSTQSIVEQQAMITRVYFPRILLPLSGVLAFTVDMLVARDHTSVEFRKEDIVVFEVLESETPRPWEGDWRGAVRPVLAWSTEQLRDGRIP